MKTLRMKAKTVEEAKKMALEVLGAKEEEAEVKVISEGKPAMLGVIGGEEAEVEVVVKGKPEDEAKEILQNIMDKMKFLAIVEAKTGEEGIVELDIKGEDMGRIIGKEGATLKALEVIVVSILGRIFGERVRINIDAGGYKEKREKTLQKMAREIAEEVAMTGEEKILPPMEASDRRVIHLCLQKHPKVVTFSEGEGKTRRLIIAPKK